jgi:glycosyltransferase involved in cell wall biosynthesis
MTFTFVVTVYRRQVLVPYVLLGVSRQEWPDWELLFVADGPHPMAASIVDDFRLAVPELAPRIHFTAYPSSPGTWGNVARRRGLECATGDYTIFLGHDCIVFPRYLSAHAENIIRKPGCLSLVDVDCWVTRVLGAPEVMRPHAEYVGIRPRHRHPIDELEIGDIDLTCMAFPTVQARELGVFAEGTERYFADFSNAYLVCNRVLPVVHRPGVVAGHF